MAALALKLFPAASIPEKAPSGPIDLKRHCDRKYIPTQEQMRYAIDLCNSRERDTNGSSAATVDSTPAPTSTPASSSTPGSGPLKKFALIKDAQIDRFYDLVGQVVKIYPSNGVVELYLTDYSSNQLLYNYEWGRDDPDAAGDQGAALYRSASSTSRKWPGPFGKLTLTVSLFPPHSYYAQDHVKENQFVFLRNTRIKHSKDGKMEGSLHTDRRNSDRVDVTIINDHTDDRVKDVLRRKLQYGKKFQHQQQDFVKKYGKDSENPGEAFHALALGQKRKQAEPPKLSKTQARKRRREQKEEEKRKRLEDLGPSDDEENKENTDPYHVRITHQSKRKGQPKEPLTPSTSPQSAQQPPKKPTNLNKNIRTSKPNIPPRPLSSILSLSTHALTTPDGTPYTLPFQNINSRAVVRVVDFFPHDIADFTVRRKRAGEFDVLSECSDVSSSSDDDCDQLPADTDDDDEQNPASSQQGDNHIDSDGASKWQWRFALVLEDASTPSSVWNPERLTAYVTDADAVFLLKLDACNLRRRSQALAALREKLFLLWGDLEERKKAGGSGEKGHHEAKSMPFECCIKEYGVRSRKPAQSQQSRARGCDGESSDDEGNEKGGIQRGMASEDRVEASSWGWDRRFAMFGTTIL
ncbi:MAG: hypothetical protein LQ338_004574 [Usnochroma carphineum]|nr:MAG: hypothetical protein LQ338_004574 [Usnochroma carphineum]